MSLKFCAIIPHSILLIPEISKDNLQKLEKTKQSLEYISKLVKEQNIETLIIISPHNQNILKNSFNINISNSEEINIYKGNFNEFGEFSIQLKFENDLELLGELNKIEQIPITFTSQDNLDYGTLVPLYYIKKYNQNIKILPIATSLLNKNEHINFGIEISKIIQKSKKNICILISVDLSHCLTKNSPSKYNPAGQVFDNYIQKFFKQKELKKIQNLNQELIKEAITCSYEAILIFTGILQNFDYKYKFLSYESPFGIGYYSAYFKIKNI